MQFSAVQFDFFRDVVSLKPTIVRWSFLNFCKIPRQYQNFGQGQIPQLSSKFYGPRKTVDPSYHYQRYAGNSDTNQAGTFCTLVAVLL